MRIAVLAAVMSFGMAPAGAATPSPWTLPLLPMPASVTMGVGSFSMTQARIAAADAGERAAGERLASLVARSGGRSLAIAPDGRIRFVRDARIAGAEAYRIAVKPRGVEIAAATDAGLYYGAETLWQLIASSKSGRIPALTIDDRPAFSWRGVMLDSARHFQPVGYVEQLIDRMAMAKLNTLHWHLSDDQGWRIQIDRYPRLTSVGAWRQEAGAAGFDPKTGKPVLYGGYYSKADIRAVVAYACAHHVTIVPEIDMPGHATAMIAAYPELASIPNPPKSPSHDWGILSNLLNPSDSTFTFVDNVLDEVMALFPGPFIHVGGDEAVKEQWKSSPAIQAKIKALGLKDEDALQSWFTARVGDYVHRRGRRLIGWDEILGGAIPADATVMSWHGIDGAITAAKSSHDAVLAASPVLYLDHIQRIADDETPGRAEVIDWRQVYDFDPAPPGLTPAERRHILGLQANLWTEHARTAEYADRMTWPRAAIVAEIGWSSAAKDWPGFSRRLAEEMARWKKLGLGYDTVPLEPAAPLAPNSRTASQLELCSNAIALRLEDDGPTTGPRAVHWVDIMHPCWIWRSAPLGGVHRLTAQVGRIPFNFAIGDDIKKISFEPPATPDGELRVRRDSCDGPVIATVPLQAATRTSGVAQVEGPLAAQSGAHDLCMTFTQKSVDPFWVLDRLTLQ